MFELVCDDVQIVHSNFSFDERDREMVADGGEIIKKSSEDGTGNSTLNDRKQFYFQNKFSVILASRNYMAAFHKKSDISKWKFASASIEWCQVHSLYLSWDGGAKDFVMNQHFSVVSCHVWKKHFFQV